MQQVAEDGYPIIHWHDETGQQVTEAIEEIPILPALIQNIENEIVSLFILLAPILLP
jgi:hypothetical protein